MRVSITTLMCLRQLGDKDADKTFNDWLARFPDNVSPVLVKAFWTEEKNNFSLIVQENKNAEA